MQALSQLSYTPDLMPCFQGFKREHRCSSETTIIARFSHPLQALQYLLACEEGQHRIGRRGLRTSADE
jgi:hypothetical protein